MFICVCDELTEQHFFDFLKENPNLTIKELINKGLCDNCHLCLPTIKKIIKSNINDATKPWAIDDDAVILKRIDNKPI